MDTFKLIILSSTSTSVTESSHPSFSIIHQLVMLQCKINKYQTGGGGGLHEETTSYCPDCACLQEFQRPVQCSDDVPQQPPSFQTGREVAVSSASQNLETDAERDQPRQDQSRQAYSNPSRGAMAGGRGDAAGRTPDVIRIEGKMSV